MRSWAVGIAPAIGLALVLCLSGGRRGGAAIAPAEIPDIETFMRIGAAGSPLITPDGTGLFFTTSQTGTRQLYRLTTEGVPHQLTFFPSGIGAFNLSRDDRWIALQSAPDGNEQYQLYLCDARTGSTRPITNDPTARFGFPVFSPDGREIYFGGNPDSAGSFYIYEQDMDSGARRVLFKPRGWSGVSDVSEDGRWLLVGHATTGAGNDLFVVDTQTGDSRLLTPHEGNVAVSAAAFGKDPHTVYVISDGNPDRIPRPAKVEWDREPPRASALFPDERSPWPCEALTISPDRRVLAWTVNEDGWGRLRLWDLEGNRALPVPALDGIVTNPALSAAGRISFSYNSPLRTADAWTWDWTNGGLAQRTFSSYAGIDPAWFVPPELVRYESFDGAKVPAFIYLPEERRNGAGAIPFIIDIHGGPEGQSRPFFNRHYQYLLLHGYGIFAPNVRGSSGYGRAWQDADNYKKRLDSVRDVAWGAKYLIARGLTTPAQLGIKGASYGGYMTLAAMTEYPDLFAAGIDEVGIANFETYYAETAAYRRDLRASEYGPPEDVEFLRTISPIHRIDRIRGALMVVHGVNDPRVPVSEARQILHALSGRGAPVDSLIFADEGHAVEKLSNRLILYRRMVDFFDRYLKNGGGVNARPH